MSFFGNMTGQKALKAHGNGNYKEALTLYEEAYAKGMDKARLLRGYCVLLIRVGNFDKALEILKKIEKTPGLDAKEKTELHVNYAIILWKKGHIDRAMEILEDELRHTKTGNLYSIIGYLKIEQGNAEEALRFNHEALEYDDADPIFLDNLAQAYYRLTDDKETAKAYFDKAYAIKPNAIDTNYFLAQYALEEGHLEEARMHLLTARKGFFSPLNFATPEKIDEQLQKLSE